MKILRNAIIQSMLSGYNGITGNRQQKGKNKSSKHMQMKSLVNMKRQ